MTVYRVQDWRGRGPWKPGFSFTWADDRPRWEALKMWMEDFGEKETRRILRERGPDEHMGCGCESIAQLCLWFSKAELHRLKVLGYLPVRMEADRILARSQVQVMFVRKKPLREDVVPVEIYEEGQL